MDKVLYYAACIGNSVLIIMALYLAFNAYGRDVLYALLIALPPFLSLMALYHGPDLEERRMRRQLTKYHLRQEIMEIKARQPQKTPPARKPQ